jgi:hypothetical protein
LKIKCVKEEARAWKGTGGLRRLDIGKEQGNQVWIREEGA